MVYDLMKKRFWLAVLFSLAVTLLLAGVALAQDGAGRVPTDDEVNAVAKELYCPVCENIPLDVCPTTACADWRNLIREKLAEGWTENQIKDYFVLQYGDRVLATPPARGLNWLVYVIPPVAILAGAYILYRAMRAWRQPLRRVEAVGPASAPEDEYIARLEEELRKR